MEYNYSDNELTALILIKIIFSSFSILWAAIIFILYWYFKDLRQFKIEIIKWLSFSCILTHVTHFFPVSKLNESSSMCAFQAFAINALSISTKVWVILILYSGILEISYEDYLRNFNIWLVRLVYNILGFGFGIAVSIPIFFTESYRNIGAWCSIDSIITSRTSIKLSVFYLFISWFLISISIYLTYQFNKMKNVEDKKLKQDLIQSIYSWVIFYPLILLICHIPHSIRIYYSIFCDDTPYWIILAETIGCSMQGFLLALTFINSPFIREALIICIKRLICYTSSTQPTNRTFRQDSINSLISSMKKIWSNSQPNEIFSNYE